MDDQDLPKPLWDNVFLRKEQNRITEAGLHIPEQAEPPYAVVVAAGPGKVEGGVFVETPVKAGDRVMIDARPGEVGEFSWKGEMLFKIPARCIAAVLPPKRRVLS